MFIRRDEHAQTAPPLLRDQRELTKAIASLPESGREQLIIVELGNEPDKEGYYRKYAAYRVADLIYPQHIFIRRHWFVKNPPAELDTPEHEAEHVTYLQTNPHRSELQSIFELAKIDYGRIDYCVVAGRIQVFEINTNPAVLATPPTPFDAHDPQPYADMHAEALWRLPGATAVDHETAPGADEITHAHNELMRTARLRLSARRIKANLRLGGFAAGRRLRPLTRRT